MTNQMNQNIKTNTSTQNKSYVQKFRIAVIEINV
jgi:hypothetical protein